MTSRERILAALNHQPVDRIPVDLDGTGQSGIAAAAYRNLRRHLRLPDTLPRVSDLVQMLAEVEPDVLERFRSDTVALRGPCGSFSLPRGDWKPFRFGSGLECLVPGAFEPDTEPDGSLIIRRSGHRVAQMPGDGFYLDSLVKAPGATHPDLGSFEVWTYPDEHFAWLAKESERLFRTTDKAVVIGFGPPYELFYGMGQGDFEEWMVTFVSEPDYVDEIFGKLIDRWIENLSRLHQAVGGHVQVLQFCDDFGTQSAPFLSVEMFRERVMPAYRRGIDWIHRHTPWQVLLHSDGAIFPLIPSLIEMGIDALNPIQTTAAGMDLARIKADFGDRITLWGASGDSQNNLTSGPSESVRQEAHRHLEILQPLEGGVVWASVHNIQANVPPENILALLDAPRHFERREG